MPAVVEAEPVDDGVVAPQPEHARAWDCRVAVRGVTVPISAKPQPSRRTASGTRASLSKPAAIPTGLGSVKPANVTPSAASSGADAAGNTPSSSDFSVISCACSGGSSVSARGAKSNSIFSMPRIPWATSARRRRRAGSANTARGAGGRQCGVEVREVIAAARDLPTQRLAKQRAFRIGSTRDRACRGSAWRACRRVCSRVDKWMIPIAHIVRRADERAAATRVLPRRARHHLEDELSSALSSLVRTLRRAQVLFSCATAMFARATQRRLRVAAARTPRKRRSLRRSFSEIATVATSIVMLPSRKCRSPAPAAMSRRPNTKNESRCSLVCQQRL